MGGEGYWRRVMGGEESDGRGREGKAIVEE